MCVPSLWQGDDGFLKAPLAFDPGIRWEYGISTDVLGRLVEKVSGQTLAEYFSQHIFQPLRMIDKEAPRQRVQPVRFYSDSGGLYSTGNDYR